MNKTLTQIPPWNHELMFHCDGSHCKTLTALVTYSGNRSVINYKVLLNSDVKYSGASVKDALKTYNKVM